MRNVGIDVLKILACLAVVSLHFGCGGFGRRLAVPIFVFFSCYLYACKGQRGSIINRLSRLWIPFLVWGVFGLLVFCLIHKGLSWSDVAWQLTFGYPAAQHLYYLIDLILMTLIIWAIHHVPTKACANLVFAVLVVACLAFQYTGLNFKLSTALHPNMRYTVGRIVELLPCAIVGDWIGELHYIDRRPMLSLVWAAIAFIVAALLFSVHRVMPEGFGYQGVLPLVMAISICVVGITVGEKVAGSKYASWMLPIASIGALTPGIYFMHDVVGKIIESLTGLSHSHLLAAVVFLISAILVLALSSNHWTKWMISGKVR